MSKVGKKRNDCLVADKWSYIELGIRRDIANRYIVDVFEDFTNIIFQIDKISLERFLRDKDGSRNWSNSLDTLCDDSNDLFP